MAFWLRLFSLVLLAIPCSAFADPAPFDLAGPTLEVRVIHAGKTLPISAVPNLSAGDQLSIKADLPDNQSAHYLMVAAFLRGATNPPPQSWFYASQTWSHKDSEGLRITVPKGAQQVLIFLAPETNGDFKAIVDAVRGQPGAFVRASQDLNQATLDRSRLKVYLAAIRAIDQSNPEQLTTASPLLARSLAIKFNPDCLQKIPELQASCLMQGQDSLILNDGHSTSIVEALTSSSVVDLAQQISSTRQADYGYYSPYISSVVDIAHIMDAFRTAQYQYIPALASEQNDLLSLELNAPPSFHNPKSVLVIALPAVEAPQLPPLHPVDPKQVYCAEKTELVLPAEGAPLAFATGYAHDMVLRLKGKNGKIVDLPVKADAEKGGFIANTVGLSPANFGDVLDGSLHGYWGFEAYNGPEFRLENAHPQHWQLSDSDQQALIAGRDDLIHIETENAACVDSILLQNSTGESVKAEWKSTGPNQVAVTVPLKKVKPGALKLLVKQYGSKQPDTVPLQSFAQAGHLDSFTFHAGDLTGTLKGSQLDAVKELTLNGVSFKPMPLSGVDPDEELTLAAADVKAVAGLKEGANATAKIALNDGRELNLDVTVASPRPKVTLLGKSVQTPASSGLGDIQLADSDELPQGAQLTFSIHAQIPAAFTGEEKIEVSTLHGAFLTTLTPANGLTLADSQVALATLNTGKAFAASAAGPLRFRIVKQGIAGDWQPLAMLVRLPVFNNIKCTAKPDAPCDLAGSNLFLLDAVSSNAHFDQATQVPEGFPGYTLSVPRPIDGRLYLKLHDDPSVVNSIAFPQGLLPPLPIATSTARQATSIPAPAKPSTEGNPQSSADKTAPALTSPATAPTTPPAKPSAQ
ncbi:MAG: hypothetical protein P4K80_06135 [Acidobacteriaceae bacterium]|nr:hypothetical protein [Acidobacteriaceae bacterium]